MTDPTHRPWLSQDHDREHGREEIVGPGGFVQLSTVVSKRSKRRRKHAEAMALKRLARAEIKKLQPKIPDLPKTDEIDTDGFYASWEWKRVRYDFLKDKGRRCECCGASPADGVRIVVDHVKPIRRYWHLRLDPTNLQMLCDDCNMGKGSRDETRWDNVVPFPSAS